MRRRRSAETETHKRGLQVTMAGVLRARPCRICRRWFRPHSRAGDRQRVCGEAKCQRERHRRACAAWRAANAEEERAERVRSRVVTGEPGEAPEERLRWPAVRDAVGLEVAVVIEETARHVTEWVRDAVAAHPRGIMKKCGGVGGEVPRDGIGTMASGP